MMNWYLAQAPAWVQRSGLRWWSMFGGGAGLVLWVTWFEDASRKTLLRFISVHSCPPPSNAEITLDCFSYFLHIISDKIIWICFRTFWILFSHFPLLYALVIFLLAHGISVLITRLILILLLLSSPLLLILTLFAPEFPTTSSAAHEGFLSGFP